MAKAEFYTYIHRKADTGEIFYVGKGKGGRAYSKQRSEYWTNVANKHGFLVEIVAYFFSEEDSFSDEKQRIADLKESGVRLCNLTYGGDGASGAVRSEETKRRMAEAKIGKKRIPETEETRRRKSESAKGRPMSPEAIAKTAAAHRGMKRSKETLERMSVALKGKNVGRIKSEAERMNMSIAQKGKSKSDYAKQRISEGHANRTSYASMTEETKLKMRLGQIAYWEKYRKAKELS